MIKNCEIFNNNKLPTLIIIRGIPGSGKTTHAKTQYPTYPCVSADDYFYTNNKYNFDLSRIMQAHDYCFNKIKKLLEQKKDCIVANTFVTRDELFKYINAFNNISEIKVIRMLNEFKDIHNVPNHITQRFKNTFYSYDKETVITLLFDEKLVNKDCYLNNQNENNERIFNNSKNTITVSSVNLINNTKATSSINKKTDEIPTKNINLVMNCNANNVVNCTTVLKTIDYELNNSLTH